MAIKHIEISRVDASSSDLRQLIAELDKYLAELYPSEDIFTVDLESPAIAEFHFTVAYIEGEAVGCGAVHPLSDSAAELKRFFVRSAFRRQGIAGRLLDALEKQAQELGASVIVLETGEPQAEAVHFYRKHGYRDIAPFGEYVDCPSSLCMEKRLNYDYSKGCLRMGDRTRFRRTKRFFWIVLVLLAVLVMMGVVYQLISFLNDRKTYTPPGELFDIGGGRLMHMYCEGQGQPTVLLESASDLFSPSWHWVQQELSGHTQVCAYDRLGQGWSDDAAARRDAARIVAELRGLTNAADLSGPFILAGHSIGGLYVQLYAAEFPDEVAGLVLVDPGNEHFFDRIPELEAQAQTDTDTVRMLELASYIGLPRLFGIGEMTASGLPERQAGEVGAFASRPRHWSYIRTLIGVLPTTYEQLKQASPQQSLRVTVMSGGTAWLAPHEPQDAMRRTVNELHAETAASYENGRHIVLDDATHSSLLLNREHAEIVAAEIAALVAAARRDGH